METCEYTQILNQVGLLHLEALDLKWLHVLNNVSLKVMIIIEFVWGYTHVIIQQLFLWITFAFLSAWGKGRIYVYSNDAPTEKLAYYFKSEPICWKGDQFYWWDGERWWGFFFTRRIWMSFFIFAYGRGISELLFFSILGSQNPGWFSFYLGRDRAWFK